ncbi:hypothetical protein QR98_0012990, partial [Sarcoptes scabiei]
RKFVVEQIKKNKKIQKYLQVSSEPSWDVIKKTVGFEFSSLSFKSNNMLPSMGIGSMNKSHGFFLEQ